MTSDVAQDPHRDARVYHLGPPLTEARGVVILLHGRGGSAKDILSLARALHDPSLAYVAPQAAGSSWYPQTFLAPRSANEPWLASALALVERLVEQAAASGLARKHVVLAGFSQGACLSTEFVATHPARFGGLLAFTGGLVGPLGSDLGHAGDLAGMPALLASGDPDPHVPWSRVQETGDVLRSMGAEVTLQRYPGRMHTVSAEEVVLANQLLQGFVAGLAGDR